MRYVGETFLKIIPTCEHSSLQLRSLPSISHNLKDNLIEAYFYEELPTCEICGKVARIEYMKGKE